MPNWLSRRVLIIALLLSLVTAGVTYYYLSTTIEQQVLMGAGPTAEVVVALQNIPAETRITREMVITRKVPAQYVHSAAATTVDEVVGKITTGDILRDEQVLSIRLVGGGLPQKRLAYSIPEGHRAITIPVNEIKGVGGYPTVGDRVDVMIIQGENPVTSRILLQNIKILATGSITTTQNDGQQRIVPSFTLNVTPEQAQIIALAEKTADIRLLLRSPVDEHVVSIPPTTQL